MQHDILNGHASADLLSNGDASAPTTIMELDTALVLEILSRVPFEDRSRHLRGVCKEWRRLSDAPGSPLWQNVSLDLDPKRLPKDRLFAATDAKMLWLRSKHQSIHHLEVFAGDGQVDDVQHDIDNCPAPMMPRLHSIRLHCGKLWLCGACGLGNRIPAQLRSLQVLTRELSELAATRAGPPLPNLTQVHIQAHQTDGLGEGLWMLKCTGLSKLVLRAEDPHPLHGHGCPPTPLTQGISALRHLRELVLTNVGVSGVPASISKLEHLHSLWVDQTSPRRSVDVITVALPPAMPAALCTLSISAARCSPELLRLSGQLTQLQVANLASAAEAAVLLQEFSKLRAGGALTLRLFGARDPVCIADVPLDERLQLPELGS